jgi:hypothetical protein
MFATLPSVLPQIESGAVRSPYFRQPRPLRAEQDHRRIRVARV